MSNDRSKTLPEFLEDNRVDSPNGRDILLLEKVPTSGNSSTGACNVATLFANSDVNFNVKDAYYISGNTVIIRKSVTPVTSSDPVTRGTIWFDADYIYCAVDTNTIKRVALESF